MTGKIYPALISAVTAAVLMTGCNSTSNSSDPAATPSNVLLVPSTGALLPYTVLRSDLEDGANPGTTFEIRNGGYGSSAAADPADKNRFYAMTVV